MAVAGSNVMCIRLQLRNGCLIDNGMSRYPTDQAQDVDAAIEALKRGESVYLRAYGDNIDQVRRALMADGVAV